MSLWDFGRSPDATSKALLLAEGLRLGPTGLPTPLSPPFGVFFGIFGVGLIYREDQKRVVAVVIMDASDVPAAFPQVVELATVPRAKNALATLFGGSADMEAMFTADVFAVGVPTPELQVATGDMIMAPNVGTCGSSARWANSQGILTAGHVGSAPSAAFSNGAHIGNVVFSRNPANGGAQVGADVALVELNPGMHLNKSVTGTVRAQPTSNVLIMRPNGGSPVQVIAKTNWFYIPASNGTYGDVYLTMTGVTQPGDSGAAVLLQNTQSLVGHVIGASGRITSYIQDIEYQLQMIRSNPAFAAITV